MHDGWACDKRKNPYQNIFDRFTMSVDERFLTEDMPEAMAPVTRRQEDMAPNASVIIGCLDGKSNAINDHVCPSCGNTRVSKSEKTCWSCGNNLHP